jgi:hypothetical protein
MALRAASFETAHRQSDLAEKCRQQFPFDQELPTLVCSIQPNFRNDRTLILMATDANSVEAANLRDKWTVQDPTVTVTYICGHDASTR